MKPNVVSEKSYSFGLKIVKMARTLRQQREALLARQVLHAGTSIGANVQEALAGVSRADFAAKMAIAAKEARETHYWLRLLHDSETVPKSAIGPLIADAEELVRILTSIVKTSQSSEVSKFNIQDSQFTIKKVSHV